MCILRPVIPIWSICEMDILTCCGSTDLSGDETFKIYYYDREKDELIFKKEKMLSDLE